MMPYHVFLNNSSNPLVMLLKGLVGCHGVKNVNALVHKGCGYYYSVVFIRKDLTPEYVDQYFLSKLFVCKMEVVT